MGKNKPVRNAFYFFMLDFKAQQPRKFENMQAIAQAAGPHWEKMNADQRRPYEQKAKSTKNNKGVTKYTTTGQDIAVVQRRENERLAKEQAMKENIESIVELAAATERIADEVFYFVHANFFCFHIATKRYFPAEIAVARFTLREGVTSDNVFHMIVKPGQMPLGYSSQAKQTSEESHQLPVPLAGDENNLTQVMDGLMKFMTESNPSNKMPPVYAVEGNRPIIDNILQNLCLDFGKYRHSGRWYPPMTQNEFKLARKKFYLSYEENTFKVHPLEYLFYKLRNSVNGAKVWPVLSQSVLQLEKDYYFFCREIACPYHEVSDVLNHCSKSHVIRLAYMICDNCCGDLGIDLIRGRHVPLRSDTEKHSQSSRPVSRAGSSSSSYVTAKQSLPPRPKLLTEEMSETSTVVDSSDFAALGDYDSEFSQVDGDGWQQQKQKHKRQNNRNGDGLSQSSTSSKPMSELYFCTPSETSTNNQLNEKQPRRPVKLSGAITGMSQMSISQSSASSGAIPRAVRGRGRGIAANFNFKMA